MAEAGVAGNQRQMFGDGVGDDDVVCRVLVVLLGVEAESCVGSQMFGLDRNDIDEEFVVDGVDDFFC